MNTDKLPGIGIAMKRAIEVFPESDHHGAVHRGDYVHGFTDAIELVKAMMRDDEQDQRWIPVTERMPDHDSKGVVRRVVSTCEIPTCTYNLLMFSSNIEKPPAGNDPATSALQNLSNDIAAAAPYEKAANCATTSPDTNVRAVKRGSRRVVVYTHHEGNGMPKTILAIDPGNKESAWVEYDPQAKAVVTFGKMPNDDVIIIVDEFSRHNVFDNEMVIEQVACMGMAVGEQVFETVFWSGRFAERCYTKWMRLKRHAVKMHMCGNTRAKDGNIRQAIIDRFGGSEAIGTKKKPGPLYGISGDVWQALALAITYAETKCGDTN